MTHGHLWDRLAEAKTRLDPVQSKYRVLFEDPATPDEPAKVLVPDPNFMAAALEGDILPPIETYQRDRGVPDGQPKEHPYAEPIGAMTEEEAIEYPVLFIALVKEVVVNPTAVSVILLTLKLS